MSLKLDEHGAWALVILILGIMGLGTWLVVAGHKAGWWLIFLPLISILL